MDREGNIYTPRFEFLLAKQLCIRENKSLSTKSRKHALLRSPTDRELTIEFRIKRYCLIKTTRCVANSRLPWESSWRKVIIVRRSAYARNAIRAARWLSFVFVILLELMNVSRRAAMIFVALFRLDIDAMSARGKAVRARLKARVICASKLLLHVMRQRALYAFLVESYLHLRCIHFSRVGWYDRRRSHKADERGKLNSAKAHSTGKLRASSQQSLRHY
jgi:hypothetical protein